MEIRVLALSVALALLGGACAWPEGQPNCPVEGNWTDPEYTETMHIISMERRSMRVFEVSLNSTRSQYRGIAAVVDERSLAVRVMAEGDDQDPLMANDSLMLNIVCLNELLYVMQTPLGTSPKMLRTFTLRRLPNRVKENIEKPPSKHPSIPPYILVNITLPTRRQDDPLQDDMTQVVRSTPG